MNEPTKTLRDEFAMIAMSHLMVAVINSGADKLVGVELGCDCYKIADGMLQARKEREDG